jgi:hypothetical protein
LTRALSVSVLPASSSAVTADTALPICALTPSTSMPPSVKPLMASPVAALMPLRRTRAAHADRRCEQPDIA